jgi:hypothetical protein
MSEYVGADFIRQSLRSGGSNDSDSDLVTQSGRLQSIDGAAQSWRVVRVFRHQPDDAGLVLDYSFHERVGFRAGAEIVDLESLAPQQGGADTSGNVIFDTPDRPDDYATAGRRVGGRRRLAEDPQAGAVVVEDQPAAVRLQLVSEFFSIGTQGLGSTRMVV